jgi:hypothetical protein
MTTLTIEDFNTLFKPGQLPDLGYFIDHALSRVTTATLLTIPDATMKALGPNITAIRTAAVSPTLNVAGSPYLADIKKVTDLYATIPTYISAYVRPTDPAIVSAGSSLGSTIKAFAPILSYIKKSIHDFDSIMLFELVLQNGAKTDPTTIAALLTLIKNYITYLNSIITTFKLDDGKLDKTYYRILSNIEKTLTKMDVIVPSAKTLDVGLFVPLVEPYVPPAGAPPPPRATPDPIIVEISKSISASINTLVTQQKLETFNNAKTIKAINQLPVIITRLAKHFLGNNAKLMIALGINDHILGNLNPIFPIPAATLELFDKGLTKRTFVANLTKTNNVGIIPFIRMNYMGNFALSNIKKVVDKSKNTSGIMKTTASSFVNKLFEFYIALLNALINIFSITITADTAIMPHVERMNAILANSDYKLLLTPQPLVGGKGSTRRKPTNRRKRARRSRR